MEGGDGGGGLTLIMTTGWSGCTDVVLALLPWNILFHMRKTLDVKKRLGIAIAMSMGLVYEEFPPPSSTSYHNKAANTGVVVPVSRPSSSWPCCRDLQEIRVW